eukprot:scaffold40700_cov16-Prasinocladus_malaysianus.AAC.1
MATAVADDAHIVAFACLYLFKSLTVFYVCEHGVPCQISKGTRPGPQTFRVANLINMPQARALQCMVDQHRYAFIVTERSPFFFEAKRRMKRDDWCRRRLRRGNWPGLPCIVIWRLANV